MRNRWHSNNFNYIFFLFLIIIISIIMSLILINYISKKIDKVLYPMAYEKLRAVVSSLINKSTEEIEFDNQLFSLDYDKDGNIKMINYNTYQVTKLINTITFNIQNKLNNLYLKNDNEISNFIIDEIPLGVVFDNSLLRNLGPKIKLRSEFIGSIISNIETEVKPYGLNNAYIEMRVFLDVKARIHLPFVSEEVTITNVIPISMNVVQGSVPNGYISSYK